MIDTKYLKYYGCDLDDKGLYWGGVTYTKQMVEEYPDIETSVTTSTAGTIVFLFPKIESITYIDGLVKGNFKIHNDTGSGITLSNFTITLKKYDIGNTETTLVSFYFTDVSNTVGDGEWLNVPFEFNCDRQIIYPYERLTVSLQTISSNFKICHDIDTKWGNDFSIELPIAIEM